MKLMKKLLLLTFVILGTLVSHAQMIYDFNKNELVDNPQKRVLLKSIAAAGEIYLKSGETIEGNLSVPEIKLFEKGNISVVCYPSKEKRTILADDIKMIKLYSTSQTKANTLIYSNYQLVKMTGNKKEMMEKSDLSELEIKTKKQKCWMLQECKGKANLYSIGAGYAFNSDGFLIPFVKGTKESIPTVLYCGQMEGRDETPILIHINSGGTNIGSNVFFRMTAPAFFGEHQISEKIRNKEDGYYKNIDIEYLFEKYNESFK